jgi:hypothetical protein
LFAGTFLFSMPTRKDIPGAMDTRSLNALSVVANQVNLRGILGLGRLQCLQGLSSAALRVAQDVVRVNEDSGGDTLVGVKRLFLDATLCEPHNALKHMEAAGHLLLLIYPGTRIGFSIIGSFYCWCGATCYIQHAHDAIDELRQRLKDDTKLMNADELKKELAYEKDFWEFAESVMIEA